MSKDIARVLEMEILISFSLISENRLEGFIWPKVKTAKKASVSHFFLKALL
jgi:hypothetical protein